MAEYHYGTGRRKCAVARVRLYAGAGAFVVNGRPAAEYFGREDDLGAALEPLRLTDNISNYTVSVAVRGGGISGQAGAIRHGVARALVLAHPETRHALRGAGLLTRDPRAKERKKAGLKRARKAPQYTKR